MNNKNSVSESQASNSARGSPDLRRQARAETNPSPRGSPELKSKVDHRKLNTDDANIKKPGPGAPLQRRRSKSDVGLVLRDKQVGSLIEVFKLCGSILCLY